MAHSRRPCDALAVAVSTHQAHPSAGRTEPRDTRYWHPFAPMESVRSRELVIDRGEGIWVWDVDGRRYLDGTASLWYVNVGHGRREIADAVHEQMLRLGGYHTFADYGNRPALELADRLAELAPVDGGRVFLGSGGGDAVETAAKLARRFFGETGQPDRVHLLSRSNGYHGTHGFGTSIAGIESNRAGHGPLLGGSSQVRFDRAESLREEIARLGPETVAAFFVEPVIGAGGVHAPPPGYIEEIAEICRSAGVLLIVDAVICGFGRLGTWFGIERWPTVRPDMIVFAKGVTSGYQPLGGVIVSDPVAAPFWEGSGTSPFRHGATYAGHPAACSAALANIAVLERDDLLHAGRDKEAVLARALAPLERHARVAEVRAGTGLLAAIELDAELMRERPDAPTEAAERIRDHGVLVRPLGSAIAVSPPLIIEESEMTLIAEAVADGLDEL